jgi:hypothetical protein
MQVLPTRVIVNPEATRWHIAKPGESLEWDGIRNYHTTWSHGRGIIGFAAYRDGLGPLCLPCEKCIEGFSRPPIPSRGTRECALPECHEIVEGRSDKLCCSRQHYRLFCMRPLEQVAP